MKTPTLTAPRDLLSLLRVVESTPKGDLQWAEHCARQQAVILRLQSPGGEVADLATLAMTTGTQIDLIDHIPVPGIAFHTRDGWHIHLSTSLSPPAQLRTALHELKHVIDHPLRAGGRTSGLTVAEHEHLADFFADIVLTGDGR